MIDWIPSAEPTWYYTESNLGSHSFVMQIGGLLDKWYRLDYRPDRSGSSDELIGWVWKCARVVRPIPQAQVEMLLHLWGHEIQ